MRVVSVLCVAVLASIGNTASGANFADRRDMQATADLPGYLGCFEDKGEDDTLFEEKSEWEDDAMTVNSCVQYCQKEGYALAALKDGDTCLCGQADVKYNKYGAKTCKEVCKGDATQICGEEDEVSVYDVASAVSTFGVLGEECPRIDSIINGHARQGMFLTDGAQITFQCNDGFKLSGPRSLTCVTPPSGKPVWDNALPICEPIYGYIGCFDNEDKKPHLFDKSTEWSDDNMTVEKCISRCTTDGYTFAGLMDGDECYCARADLDFQGYGAKKCKDRCSGDDTQVCGEDDDEVSVYNVSWYNLLSKPLAPSNGNGQNTGAVIG